jgi:class 3 adenylate cyclase
MIERGELQPLTMRFRDTSSRPIFRTRRSSRDVNVAARLEKSGVVGRVHVSEETMQLTGDVFAYQPRGTTHLRGVGAMSTYLLGDHD